MTTSNPIHDILRKAIQREIEAYTLYSTAAQAATLPNVQEILNDLAAQEVGHRNRLEALLNGRVFQVLSQGQQKKIVDLKITDYLIDVPLAANSDFQDILIVAGKREKASHDLYASLAQVAEDGDTTRLFEFLATEELAHKNRVESLYEQLVLKDN